ncbi:MAG: hypothetical protein EOO85_14440 [Pedobacter sp.]|nr:MAG: hypothetical protein EOO85_14440 [Pedobacter sp.]
MHNSKISFTLVIFSILLIASTWIGIPLNGGDKGWIYVNGPFRDFVYGIHYNLTPIWEILRIVLIGWNVVLFITPLLILTKYKRIVMHAVPAIYLLLSVVYSALIAPLCIPFLAIWIGALVYLKKQKRLFRLT